MRRLHSAKRAGTTAVLPGLATCIVAAVIWAEAGADASWHTKWRRVRLTAEQEAQAKLDMKAVIEWPGTAKYHADQLAKKVEGQRYDPVVFAEKKYGARYAPLCRLQFAQLNPAGNLDPQKPRKSYHTFCSCSFVRPDILMTAAHCLLRPDENWGKGSREGKARDIRPATGWLVYVVQAYGGEAPGKYAEYTLSHAQVLVEWWTPAKFTGNEADLAKNRYADVAFAKVRNENELQAKRSTYVLRTPKGTIGEDGYYDMFGDSELVTQLGYPAAYMDSEMPVQITGQVKRCKKRSEDGRDMAFFGQAKKEMAKKDLLKLFRSIKQVDSEDGSSDSIVGNMGRGGSGGPLIVANADIVFGRKDPLYMTTFGATSTCIKDADNDPTRRCKYALIQPEMIEALDQIARLPLNFAAPQKVDGVGKAAATANEGVEMIELELPKAEKAAADKAAKEAKAAAEKAAKEAKTKL